MCVVKQKESNYTTRGERSSSDRVETAASALCFSSNHQQQQPRGEERNEESTATAAADVQRENEPGSTQHPTAQDSNANIANYHRKEKTTRNKNQLVENSQ
jgi:hypothetical protein